ncbi:MAG: hypothetical protein ABIR06_13685 [Cyclobacteriaceae bacterium]
MDYVTLSAGIILFSLFVWLFIRTRKDSQKGIIYDALRRFDIVVGIVAGLYLILTSIN